MTKQNNIPSESASKQELIIAIEAAVNHLISLLEPLDPDKLNDIPFKDSWTPGQLFNHVTKSIYIMAKAMASDSKHAERNAGEKIVFLKKIFLDFEKKLNAPDIITPSTGTLEKEAVIQELQLALNELVQNSQQTDLHELVQGLPLGEVTKLEILHFTLYHTMRHTHQFEKISAALAAGA